MAVYLELRFYIVENKVKLILALFMSCFSNNQEQILEKYQDFSLPSYVRTILSVYSWQYVSL